MRVVHIAPTAFGVDGLFGGGERYPLELARALASEIDCELVTFGRNPGALVDAAGLRVRVLRPWALVRGHPAHPLSAGLPTALASADLVHAHHMRSAPSRLAAVAGRWRRQRLAVTDHGLGGGGWAGILPRMFHAFLTVSRYSAETLRAPPRKTRVIYGGTDPRRFRPDADVVRRGALSVGRLTPHKGIDVLIEALPPRATLTVAGSGGHDPRPPASGYPRLLRRMASGRDVRFVGTVAEEELPALYRRAVVLALPSVHHTCYGGYVEIPELLSLVALEAMASGTPVIASRVGGLPEVVKHGETGYLVAPGDAGELRDRLSMLLGDRALAARLGMNARRHVIERFTWDACARRCLAAYDELLTR